MNWINNLFYMGLFTALTGSIAFAVYAVVAGVSALVTIEEISLISRWRFMYSSMHTWV